MKKVISSLFFALSFLIASAQNISINDMFNIYNRQTLLKASSIAKLLGFELKYTEKNDNGSYVGWGYAADNYSGKFI